MKKIKDMSNKELKDEYYTVNDMIENFAFGTRDVIRRGDLEIEIARRGGIIQTSIKIKFKKE